jgi:hypothetical protein
MVEGTRKFASLVIFACMVAYVQAQCGPGNTGFELDSTQGWDDLGCVMCVPGKYKNFDG